MGTLARKTIFITGSSSGLGRASAFLFARKGWRVIATMRNPERDQALASMSGVTLLALDVTKPEQIEDAVASAIALGPVDVVFNNAGYGICGPLEGTTDAEIVRVVDTNLLGVIRTTKAFIPYFRERRAGLFMATTSIGGLAAFPLNSMYHATKWAIEGFSESLAFELSKFGIGVKTIAPGGMNTDFMGRSMVLTQHTAYSALVAQMLAALRDPATTATHATAEQIAEVVYEAATDGKDQLRYVAGEDAKAFYAKRQALGGETFRKAVEKMFFG